MSDLIEYAELSEQPYKARMTARRRITGGCERPPALRVEPKGKSRPRLTPRL
jgi:hypothetical protein